MVRATTTQKHVVWLPTNSFQDLHIVLMCHCVFTHNGDVGLVGWG
jgi:hypothetical protein